METPTKRYKKLRKKSNTNREDNVVINQIQSYASSMITFVFAVYLCGIFSIVMSLPPLNPKEVLPLNFPIQADSSVKDKGVGLNIAKHGFSRGQDDDDELENVEVDGQNEVDKQDQQGGEDEYDDNDEAINTPKSIWPVSVTQDKSDWFELFHPGDEDIKITVPPFWSLPIHNNSLMTRTQALSIGTCAVPDPSSGSFQRGEECPLNERTIFVAIASYRDWQCRYTIESIFNRAKYPHRIRVGVVDQIVDGDDVCNVAIDSCEDKPDQALCKFSDQVDNYIMDAPLSVGPVFARHIGHRLYRGEYYTMQSDAHVTFTQNWDVDIIEQQEATGDEMAVLTTYLTDIVGSIDKKTGKSLRSTRPIMCNTVCRN